ncbi:sialate O-acetylesterase [Echinicola strongylocentroti]|uniref:Sialate O-acetylesterase n=1 Tax=Echinicola strongylocentroti TaxID=1795355 RepID=A0A2Z4IQZ5_9BACT|nr:sialate O-acetylesterase [Echinicola strongylocentroti]AWW32723.1 sialate O-acetylesterase [Echinicola strongylocentroti]
MMNKYIAILITFLSIQRLGIAASFAQDLTVSTLFCDHMVLQRGTPVPVWGKARPSEGVTVTFAGQRKSTTADKNGKWELALDPLSASKEGGEMTITGSTEVVISDVVVGEVWICSGQSNMQFGVSQVPEVRGLVPFAKDIRSFEVKRTVALEEQDNVSGKWERTHPSSAVAFSFAYFLNDLGDVPVGIIHASWGSSSIEAWMPRDMTKDLPHFKTIMDEFDRDTARTARIQQILAAPDGWTGKEDVFLRRQPNILYNAMMHPLAPFACRGLLWYQGERNTRYMSGMPEVNSSNWFHRVAGIKEYGGILGQWIKRYRKEWDKEDMHFMIVMLPGYGKGTDGEVDPEKPTEPSWAWMRESQMEALALPGTSVINTIDLGELSDVHPTDKLPIGQRGALLAANHTLQLDVLAAGPIMNDVEIQKGRIVVHFDNAEGLKTVDGRAPAGFWITDDTGNWVRAESKIDGESVILSSPKITNPHYVRYAFAGKPKVNLVNANELPAYPFRTDREEE